jgi:hypothetical protein
MADTNEPASTSAHPSCAQALTQSAGPNSEVAQILGAAETTTSLCQPQDLQATEALRPTTPGEGSSVVGAHS